MESNRSKYLNHLKNQYMQALGIYEINNNNEEIKYMSEWIKNRRSLGISYLDFLENHNLFLNDSSCGEIGKGKYDSVLSFLDKPTIITPYISTFESVLPKYYLGCDFSIDTNSGKPYISNIIDISCPGQIESYITQNIYSINEIKRWPIAYFKDNKKIIVGAYGQFYEKDRKSKIAELQFLKNKLGEHYLEYYDTNKDGYFYVICSDTKSKKIKIFK